MNVKIEKIRYYKEQTSFGIYEVSSASSEKNFISVHSGNPLKLQERYRFVGYWDDYRNEKQFVVTEVFPPDPDSLSGLLEILTNPNEFAFPKDIATRIVKQYGMETLSLIRENPNVFLNVPGVTKYRIAFLEERYSKEKPMEKFEEYLLMSQITPSMIKRILHAVDKEIVSLIQYNPYLLCRFDPSFFSVAELLRKKTAFEKDSPERIEGAFYSVLLQNEKYGNLRISEGDALKKVEELLKIPVSFYPQFLLNNSTITKEDGFLYLQSSFLQMHQVAVSCKRLLCGFSSPFSKEEVFHVIKNTEKELELTLSNEQREAIFLSEQSGISIILGKPGSGKTTVIRALLAVLKKLYGESFRVMLGAPTGIAAWRMSASANGKKAYTLHKLLGLFPGEETSKVSSFQENAFLIDELSMVDLSLFSMFIEKIPCGSRLILLGDSNQLSSIGPGDVLNDLIKSQIPHQELTKIYRQSSINSNITHNASLLLEHRTDFSFGGDFAFFPADSFSKASESLLRLFLAQSKVYGVSEVKILCPYRDWVDSLNPLIAEEVNPPQKGKGEIRINNTLFREGDLVLESQNQTLSYNEKIKVNNGDIGTLFQIEKISDETLLHISFPGDRVVVYSLTEAKSLKHAYALTIHKSQGSEFHCVLMCLLDSWNDPSEGRMLSKSLLYTAMTRAKKQFYWVGSMEILPQIYEKNEDKRNTGLSGFIRKEVKQ